MVYFVLKRKHVIIYLPGPGTSWSKVYSNTLLRGITKESTEWSEWPETDFLFNTEIEIMKKRHVKYLYVITDCTYASKIEIEVSVDGWMRSDEVKGKIPVAFSCTKFPIDEKGFLMRTAVPKTTKTSSSFRPAPVNYYYSDTD